MHENRAHQGKVEAVRIEAAESPVRVVYHVSHKAENYYEGVTIPVVSTLVAATKEELLAKL